MGHDIDNLGFPKKDIQKFKKASASSPRASFILPFSLIDLSLRDSKFSHATQAKIAAYLILIHQLFPGSPVEFLIGDTLRSENSGENVEALKQSWGKMLNLPMDQLSRNNRSLTTQYDIQHQFSDDDGVPSRWDIQLSSWDKYQKESGSAVGALMQKVRETLYKLAQNSHTDDNNAIHILTNDMALFQQHCLGFVRNHFNQLFHSLSVSKLDLDELTAGFAQVAAHHIQKTHQIILEPTHDKSLKKKNILKAVQNPDIAVKEFIDSFCYTLEETLVIFDILTRQARDQGVQDNARIWMLYPSGITDVPDFHPVKLLNEILHTANMPRTFYTGAAFQFPYNDHKIKSSSNGGNTTMIRTTSAPKLVEKQQPMQTDNNSLVNKLPKGSAKGSANGSAHNSDDEATANTSIGSSNSSLNSGDGRQPPSPQNRPMFEMDMVDDQVQKAAMLKARLELLQDGASDYLAENPDDFRDAMTLFKRTATKIQGKIQQAAPVSTSAPTQGYARAIHDAKQNASVSLPTIPTPPPVTNANKQQNV